MFAVREYSGPCRGLGNPVLLCTSPAFATTTLREMTTLTFHENTVFGRDGWPQPSSLMKSGAVGPPRPTIFIRGGELEKIMGHFYENVLWKSA